MKIYLVGGAVRDKLLGETIKERDWVVVGAAPAEMEARGFRCVGKDFPVFLHPNTHEEHALARTERKTAPGYHGFAVHAAPNITLEQDLGRRDLTINAIAESQNGELIDPFNGRKDLQNRILRHVSPAFAEDPVRILRVARFAARFGKFGFRVAGETNALMKEMVARGEADALVAERVWKELARALGEEQPARFFEVLIACGALPSLFPELSPLFTAPTLEKLTQAAQRTSDRRVRFAVLLHGLGDMDPSVSLELFEKFCHRLRIPNDYRQLAEMVIAYYKKCAATEAADGDELLQLLEGLDAFRRSERFERFLLACEIILSRTNDLLRAACQAAIAVDPKPLAKKGLKGEEIRVALRDERTAAIIRGCFYDKGL
ncbi:MAG: multifunctional CCA addition/repair protein [Gammaproteobacteria bacterium]|nr:multifunctional CCA addition/repair protein [Gammaproteobacteria bacterium]